MGRDVHEHPTPRSSRDDPRTRHIHLILHESPCQNLFRTCSMCRMCWESVFPTNCSDPPFKIPDVARAAETSPNFFCHPDPSWTVWSRQHELRADRSLTERSTRKGQRIHPLWIDVSMSFGDAWNAQDPLVQLTSRRELHSGYTRSWHQKRPQVDFGDTSEPHVAFCPIFVHSF